MDDLEATVKHEGGWTVLTVSGDLDALTGPALGEAIVDHLADSSALVIDLSAVGFLDSSGLGVLVRALKHTRERGAHLRLVIDSEQILKLLKLTALDLVFDVVPDVRTATSTPA